MRVREKFWVAICNYRTTCTCKKSYLNVRSFFFFFETMNFDVTFKTIMSLLIHTDTRNGRQTLLSWLFVIWKRGPHTRNEILRQISVSRSTGNTLKHEKNLPPFIVEALSVYWMNKYAYIVRIINLQMYYLVIVQKQKSIFFKIIFRQNIGDSLIWKNIHLDTVFSQYMSNINFFFWDGVVVLSIAEPSYIIFIQ